MWKDIDGNYEVSNLGEVRNKKSKKILKVNDRLRSVHLYRTKKTNVPNLVWDHFSDEPRKHKGYYVALIDPTIKKPYRISNLKQIHKSRTRKDTSTLYLPIGYSEDTHGNYTEERPHVVLSVSYSTKNTKKLMNPEFLNKRGQELFDFLFNNCPSGIFKVLVDKIESHKNRFKRLP